MRWEIRKRPPLLPAGLSLCAPHEVAKWKQAHFGTPVYQFRDRNCLRRPDGRLEPPNADERERLMGFTSGHTIPARSSSQAKHNKLEFEYARRALVGNSFQCDVVAWLLAHLLCQLGLLAAIPSPADLRSAAHAWRVVARARAIGAQQPLRGCIDEIKALAEDSIYIGRGCPRLKLPPSKWANPFKIGTDGDRHTVIERYAAWVRGQPALLQSLGELAGRRLFCHCSLAERCHGDVLLWLCSTASDCPPWRDFDSEQRVVYEHLRAVDLNGSDVRLDAGTIMSPKCWPRQELDVDLWRWKVVVQMEWQHDQHINVLEARAALAMLRWRTRSCKRLRRFFLHLLDSQVNIAVLTKHRSSSRLLQQVLKPFSALELASGCRGLFGFTSSGRNPADKPSRWVQK